MWPEIEPILAPGATRVPVHERYSLNAQVTVLTSHGWWTYFVHCGPPANLPARPTLTR